MWHLSIVGKKYEKLHRVRSGYIYITILYNLCMFKLYTIVYNVNIILIINCMHNLCMIRSIGCFLSEVSRAVNTMRRPNPRDKAVPFNNLTFDRFFQSAKNGELCFFSVEYFCHSFRIAVTTKHYCNIFFYHYIYFTLNYIQGKFLHNS